MMEQQQRPFFKSSMYWTTNSDFIPQALMNGFNVVVLVDVDLMGAFPGCVGMSNLLPHPPLVMQILSTDKATPGYETIMEQYMIGYQHFLSESQREESIVNLLASMYKTTHPVLLYAEPETERQFFILKNMCLFFQNMFGINIGWYDDMYNTANALSQPSFIPSPQFIYRIIDLLFVNAYITKKEDAMMLPQGMVPSVRVASILLSDFNCVFPTMQAAFIATCNIVEALRIEATTGMVVPAVKITKELDQARQDEITKILENPNTRFGLKGVKVQQLENMTPKKVPDHE